MRISDWSSDVCSSELIALGAEVERNQIGLAVRKHRDRRRRTAEMTARIKFGERRLDRAVAAVDDDAARGPHRHRADRFADLVDVLNLLVKGVGMRGAILDR